MKEIVFLAGVLIILLYALALTRERDSVEDYEVVCSRKIEQRGDTIIVEQKMIKKDECIR